MNHRRHGGGCTLLAAALLAGVTALPAPAAAQIYGAKATRVADTPPAGSNGDAVVTLSARFLTSGPLDLSSVKAAVLSVLLEGGAGGAGELLQGTAGASLLPVTLEPNRGARADSAIFATPGSARPSVRLAVKHRGGGEYQMNLRVNRATIPIGPALCSADDPSTTTLSTAIAFGDGVGPVSGGVMLTQPWRCESGRQD